MSRDSKGSIETWGAVPADNTTNASGPETSATAAAPGQQPGAKPWKRESPSVIDAARSIKPDDFLHVHQNPCARQGLLTGIGGGAALGAARYVLGAPIPKAANWAVGAFAVSSLVSYEYCQYLRRAERAKMKRIVEVYDHKHAEMRQKEEEAKRRKQQEEAEAARIAAQKRWYKFW